MHFGEPTTQRMTRSPEFRMGQLPAGMRGISEAGYPLVFFACHYAAFFGKEQIFTGLSVFCSFLLLSLTLPLPLSANGLSVNRSGQATERQFLADATSSGVSVDSQTTIPVGSAVPPLSKMDKADIVREEVAQRVNARWQALIRQDIAEAYTFETPAYRKTYTSAQYAARFGSQVVWTGVDVLKLEIDQKSQHAKVQVQVSYTALLPNGGTYDSQRVLIERWKQQDGRWWYLSD